MHEERVALVSNSGFSYGVTLVPYAALSMGVMRRLPCLQLRKVTVSGWSHGLVHHSVVTKSSAVYDAVAAECMQTIPRIEEL